MKNKNMYGRAFSLILAVIMIFTTLALTGCPSPNPNPNPDDPDNSGNGGATAEPMLDPVDDNYRTFYQIFVGSFSDGNNDGIGDLRGVINRMDYLNDGDMNNGNDLGVQGIWLSPIFSSNSYHKYDAKDYYTIDWRFGDEATLVELINLCHERNVKIILDLAINHTSTQHPWFIEFKKARMEGDTDNKYYNWYTCVTASQRNNGSMYSKIGGTSFYYECNFSGDMPELNFDNPDVVDAMLDVARYYMNLGVDGFRFDAVKYIYYGDTARNVTFWNNYVGTLCSEYPDIYTVGECWSGDNEILQYYGKLNCFDFSMSGAEGKVAMAAKGNGLTTYVNYVVSFLNSIKSKNPDGMLISFLSNHDQDRIAGSFVTDNQMKMAASLYLLCSGSPVIYYGEEIGMRGKRDPAIDTDADRRLAMLWGDGDLVRNPTGATYSSQIDSDVTRQLADPNSVLNHYSKLLSIRQRYPAVARGSYSAITSSDRGLAGFLVTYNDERLVILHNVSTSEIRIDLSALSGIGAYRPDEICEIVGAGQATLNGTTLTISGQTSIILK